MDEKVKDERLQAVQQLLNAQQVAFNQTMIGRNLTVLFDRVGKLDGQLLGRSAYMQSVYVQAPARLMGQMVEVHVTGAFANSLSGHVVTGETMTQAARPAVEAHA